MTRWLRRLWARTPFGPSTPPPIDDADWQRLLRRVGWARALDPSAQQSLRRLTERFLADKAIVPAGGCLLPPERRRLVALLCCQPVLHLGYEWLQGWREVIVYPGEFRVRRHDYDEDTGVVEEWDDDLVGESWQRGPLILSWADLRADLDRPEPGYHVVAHEIAHKLDALDGAMDGMPPLRDTAQRLAWARDFQTAFDALRADLDAQREPAIDAYAAEAPDEFFAVASEYHFSAPDQLRTAFPDVAQHLARFYGPPSSTD
ncbi:MAG: zinc-dependent peptidase [Chiayiivirga sp.]|jgi:Mlc titration factor MtfA (ptsG expression regulator)|uniref:M90 family metallopeptidase n=1 Tax=Chiayiivirga sp. TaxID=2041042 RepID=UPI0025C0F9D8|nr:M90 family metallopeptidase [Chiayiivirga sp.]MCI1710814.1 zinc-dependent peptidase [Chiayiivirga sp.]MCI1728346.1 zinc-dependent peptidase [Chiayiivirga sp.]